MCRQVLVQRLLWAPMKTATTTIVNRLGLHARPCAMLVGVASKFQSEIWLERDGLKVNGKSIMGVMMLAAEQGTALTITAEGPDEEASILAVCEVIASGFNEMRQLPQ